jgi:hypothetical protein
MPTDARVIRIFAASPKDVADHREALRDVVDELNQSLLADRSIILQLKTWLDVAPDMGRPEEVILDQIAEFEIFIGIMGQRFGSSTGKYEAGTEEEFYTAYDRWQETESPRILFYFNQEVGPFPETQEQVAQLSKVLTFKAIVEELGLVRGYRDQQELVRLVRRDLNSAIRDLDNKSRVAQAKAEKVLSTGHYWDIWRDASLETRLPGERVEAAIYRVAQNSIDFLTISGRSIYSGGIEELLLSKPSTFRVRLLLFDWNSPEFPEKMRDERRENDVLIEMARHTGRSNAQHFLRFATGMVLNVKIKLYREYPVWRLLIADKQTAYVGYYPRGKRGYEGPMFIFSSGDTSSLFAPVSHYFETLWRKSGKPLTIDDPRFELLPLDELKPADVDSDDD